MILMLPTIAGATIPNAEHFARTVLHILTTNSYTYTFAARQTWPAVFLTLHDERVYCQGETECILYNIYTNLQLHSINFILHHSS